jgi:CelD/BcsL family acetyltransferase involved in cellulose biosynthesis
MSNARNERNGVVDNSFVQTASRFDEFVLMETSRQLGDIVDEWRAFAARQEDCSYFQTPDWVLTWWRHHGRPRTVVACWRDAHGALEAVAFLSEVRERVHRRVGLTTTMLVNAGSGASYFADRCGWPMIPTRASDVREWAAAYRPSVSLVLRNLDQQMTDRCVPRGAQQVLRTCAPVLDLTEEPEHRLANNLAKQIPRFRRRLEGMGVTFRWIPPGDVSPTDLDTLFDLHESRYGLKHGSTFDRDVHVEFHRSLAEVADRDGGPAIVIAERDGDPVAMQYGFVWQQTFHQYQSGWRAEYAEHRVGTVVVAEAIRLARENGMHSFDLLRGDEAHKYRFGAVDRDDETWLLPRGVNGQLLRAGFGLTRFNEGRRRRREVARQPA